MLHTPKRVFVGRPLRSDRLGETLLPKRLALPVFCSDPLQLGRLRHRADPAGARPRRPGAAAPDARGWRSAVVALLVIVVASYRQTCFAYPNGGGAYAVSRRNLGVRAGLVAASALLVDYVLTVAVSVVAGVAAITSALPALAPHAVALSLGFVVLLTLVNLRGVKESGPGLRGPDLRVRRHRAVHVRRGRRPAGDRAHRSTAESAALRLVAEHRTGGLLAVFLALRAFACGCTALTGVEAVSNGVPDLPGAEAPERRHHAGDHGRAGDRHVRRHHRARPGHRTCTWPRTRAADRAAGRPGAEDGAQPDRPAPCSVTAPAFYLLQAFTAAILILAANTAYNGFPVLASLLAHDGYLPRQLARRGDRLVFSNGIVLLAALAGVLIVAFDADVTRLIQLYIIGVFVSFTLSQAGMVRHWSRELRDATRPSAAGMRRSQAINLAGAVATASCWCSCWSPSSSTAPGSS